MALSFVFNFRWETRSHPCASGILGSDPLEKDFTPWASVPTIVTNKSQSFVVDDTSLPQEPVILFRYLTAGSPVLPRQARNSFFLFVLRLFNLTSFASCIEIARPFVPLVAIPT